MIKSGNICVFDKKYNYLYDLEEGSYFGEYNIMFGLYSSLNYKGKSVCDHHQENKKTCPRNVIYKIPAYQLMKIITEDVQVFKHFHDIALQKFRFNNKMI
jgi:hypothetical protein